MTESFTLKGYKGYLFGSSYNYGGTVSLKLWFGTTNGIKAIIDDATRIQFSYDSSTNILSMKNNNVGYTITVIILEF